MTEFTYKVVFSGRRSMSIIVSPDKGVTVRVPFRTSLKTVEEYVDKKSGWIKKHLESFTDLKRIKAGKQYINGEVHMFGGKEYQLKLNRSDKPFIHLTDSTIEIGLHDPDDKSAVRSFLERWYAVEAFSVMKGRLHEILNQFPHYNFRPSRLTIRPLKSRWGSCTSKGRISLNGDLVKLDPKYTDYVIIHELCHLRHHNHGKEFYGLLTDLYPEWKKVRAELRRYIR